jgi:GTP cyclohydrolase II
VQMRPSAISDISEAVAIQIESATWYASAVRAAYPEEGHTGGDHLILAYVEGMTPRHGQLPQIPSHSVPVRIHSECLFGDIFDGHRCDCGTQLRDARAEIVRSGFGVLLYLRQEGRGIGLYDKIRSLLEPGDTFERNIAIGRPEDARGYGLAAGILQRLGIQSVRLLSGNPNKARALERAGFEVTLCSYEATEVTVEASQELAAKLQRGYTYQRSTK